MTLLMMSIGVEPELNLIASMEASMGRVIEQFAQHTNMDADTIETELFAAIRALEVDPKNMTVDELRQCLLIYLDEVFYGISPEKTQ